jgi:putative component of membrane protein insertase Oxa1/YidC/SpoIIIJ protein YidD
MKRLGLLGYWLMLIMLVILFTKAPPALAAEDPMNGPWDSPQYKSLSQKQKTSQRSTSIGSPFFTSLLTFFSEVISPVDGDRCPSYPTCAAYSKEAYQKHGAFIGTLMTVDRLFHEADEYRFSPTVKVYGVHRIYDPVSANEYWKRKP